MHSDHGGCLPPTPSRTRPIDAVGAAFLTRISVDGLNTGRGRGLKGFKVCRVEQTETPDQVKKRIAGRRGLSKIEKGMRREVCSLTTPGTRLYTVLDMRLEKEGGGFEPVSGPTHLAAVCEQGSTVGVCVCDSPTGTFTLAQFEDDVQRTRLRTLLAALPPAEVLIPRGSRDLAEICERATGASVELLTPTSEFLDADSCIEYLSAAPSRKPPNKEMTPM